MTALHVSYADGNLEIDSVPLRGPAWNVTDLTDLWQYGDRRGQDRIIPGAAGVRPYRRRRTVTAYSLPMVIIGDVDPNGDPYDGCDDVWVGFETNYAGLVSALVSDPGTVAGTRTAVLTMPSGATRTGDVHVTGIILGQGFNGRALATLELSLPNGQLQ